MKIAYIFQPGRLQRFDEALAGNAATEFFYGALELRARGHDVSCYELGDSAGKLTLDHLFLELMNRIGIMPPKAPPILFRQIKRIVPLLHSFDIVIGAESGIAFTLAAEKLRKQWCGTLIGIHCGFLHYYYNKMTIHLTRLLFAQMYSCLFGEGEKPIIQKRYKVPNESIEVIPFGVDTKFWRPDEGSHEKHPYILAVGNDFQRDYALLIEIAKLIDMRIKVITERDVPADIPPNVEVIRGSYRNTGLSDLQLRELYRKALFTVIPLKPSFQPSGQSVALQSMACGTPVIMTKTEGLWEHRYLRDMENIVFIHSNKPEEWAGTIDRIIADQELLKRIGEAALRYVSMHGQSERYTDRLEQLCLTLSQTRNVRKKELTWKVSPPNRN
jgi:glycosyltransferase involved in cell wall biosynthesis